MATGMSLANAMAKDGKLTKAEREHQAAKAAKRASRAALMLAGFTGTGRYLEKRVKGALFVAKARLGGGVALWKGKTFDDAKYVGGYASAALALKEVR